MAEPELAFTRKTFSDTFGKHALVYLDDEPGALNNRCDVNRLLPPGAAFHPTRLADDYQPKHAAPVAERNTAACACAVTEASQRRCPQHGEDQFLAADSQEEI